MTFSNFLASAAIVLGVGFATNASAYGYETVKGDPSATRIYTLPNGLKVYLSVNKEKPRIQTYIAVRTRFAQRPCRNNRSGTLP